MRLNDYNRGPLNLTRSYEGSDEKKVKMIDRWQGKLRHWKGRAGNIKIVIGEQET